MVQYKGHIKLQLEVNIKNEMILGGDRALETYYLMIKFLDKDDAYEANFKGNRYVIFGSKNGFRIRSVWDEPYGSITDDGLMLPQLDRVGFELKKTFPTDMDRYLYLKNLHTALKDWADNWEGFKYDSESIFRMDDNVWTISCERRKKGGEKRHYHTTRELMKRNIFF
jgi:hypothetical protein